MNLKESCKNFLLLICSTLLVLVAAEAYFSFLETKSFDVEKYLKQASPKIEQDISQEVSVLVVGGSSAQMTPYYFRLTDLLGLILKDSLPATTFKEVEGHRSGDSLQKRFDVAAKGLLKRPTFFILYSGHNEFLSHFSPNHMCEEEDALLIKVVEQSAMVRFFLERIRLSELDDYDENRPLFDVPVACSKDWARRYTSYRYHLNALTKLSAALEVPTILIFPAGNEAGDVPNRSVYTAREDRKEEFRSLYLWGRYHLLLKDWNKASLCFDEALEIDSNFAGLLYWKAVSLLNTGEPDEARKLFELAKDKDYYPVRGSSVQRGMMRSVADKFDAYFLDARSVVLNTSREAQLDRQFFVDTNHQSSNGYLEIAKSVAKVFLTHFEIRAREFPGREKLKQWVSEQIYHCWFCKIEESMKMNYGMSKLTFDSEVRLELALKYLHLLKLREVRTDANPLEEINNKIKLYSKEYRSRLEVLLNPPKVKKRFKSACSFELDPNRHKEILEKVPGDDIVDYRTAINEFSWLPKVYD